MSTEENKALLRRDMGELWGQGNLAVAEEVYATDVVLHNAPPGLPPGIEGVKGVVTAYRAAFPDLHVTIQDEVAEGDRVVLRWTMRGTQKGEFFGIPATGKPMTLAGIVIARVADSKIAEVWASTDQLGMMQQLGVIPTPGE
jgi:steroid delta-isomerase-like uncharacterized protein